MLASTGTLVTVNVRPLLVPPSAVTVTGPVVAPAGTVAVTVVALTTANVVAVVPLKLTAEALIRSEPVIVTCVPTSPEAGLSSVSVGGAGTVKVLILLAMLTTWPGAWAVAYTV